jgi:aspartate dehydrogenase
LLEASKLYNRKIYVPCGAFWGASDIKKMANKNTLTGLKVTMKKHPDSLKLEGSLKEKLDAALPLTQELILYKGLLFSLETFMK